MIPYPPRVPLRVVFFVSNVPLLTLDPVEVVTIVSHDNMSPEPCIVKKVIKNLDLSNIIRILVL